MYDTVNSMTPQGVQVITVTDNTPVVSGIVDRAGYEALAFLIGAVSAIPGGILFMVRKELRPQKIKGDFD